MSRFHCLTSLLMLIAILAATTNYAAASPASAVAGALGAAAAKKVVKEQAPRCIAVPVTYKDGVKLIAGGCWSYT